MKKPFLLVISTYAAVGCASSHANPPAATAASEPETTSVAPVTTDTKLGDSTMTSPDRESARAPLDQAGDAVDLKITKQIRESLMADDNLSFPAKNIDITTDDRKVTLRGPVKTAEERAAVESKARQVDSVREVDNEVVITQ